VIQPWDLSLSVGEEKLPLRGLYRVDQAKLDALNGEAFLKLRAASSLPLAYLQLVSMQTVGAFRQLAALQKQLATVPSEPKSLVNDDSGIIRFN